MATALVTGGTGVLGSRVVPALIERGFEVRILSRSTSPEVTPGLTSARGDVRTGDGLDAAMDDVQVVLHAATNPARRARSTEVDGTMHVLRAAHDHGVEHVVYVSIVGVDRNRLPYYRAKWAAEQLVEDSSVPWTIQRITQFHDLLDRFLGFGVFPRASGLAFQPIDVTEAAGRLADLAVSGPGGRAADIGGPETLGIRDLRDIRREVTGRRTILVPAPRVGPLKDFAEGHHLVPGEPYGQRTWRSWLGRTATKQQPN